MPPKLRLDLATTAGRAAMRAYLDALDAAATEIQPGDTPTPAPEGDNDPMRGSVNRPPLAGVGLDGIGSSRRGHCESVATPEPAGRSAEGDACPDDPDGVHFVGCGCDRDEGDDVARQVRTLDAGGNRPDLIADYLGVSEALVAEILGVEDADPGPMLIEEPALPGSDPDPDPTPPDPEPEPAPVDLVDVASDAPEVVGGRSHASLDARAQVAGVVHA